MKVPQHPTLIRRMLAARVGRLAAQRPVLTASLDPLRHIRPVVLTPACQARP